MKQQETISHVSTRTLNMCKRMTKATSCLYLHHFFFRISEFLHSIILPYQTSFKLPPSLLFISCDTVSYLCIPIFWTKNSMLHQPLSPDAKLLLKTSRNRPSYAKSCKGIESFLPKAKVVENNYYKVKAKSSHLDFQKF